MSSIHFVLQGKGGVGKSLVAAFLAQYFSTKSDSVYCADTDPVNDTFAKYGAFAAERFKILNSDQLIDQRAFDALIEKLLEHDGVSVVDNGSSTFIPLSAYMVENHVIDMLKEAGKTVYLHTIVTGGQALDDTMIGLNALLKQGKAPVVVWENEFFGDVAKNGVNFTESSLYTENKEKIKGLVTIDKRNQDTFGKDMELLVSNRLTFQEAMSSDKFTMMPRQRLKLIQKSIFDQLDAIAF